MNAKAVCESQNAFGRFFQNYNTGKKEGYEELFSKKSEACLWMPDRSIRAVGCENICSTIRTLMQQREAEGFRRDLHVPHTATYWSEEDGTIICGTWDLFSFVFSGEKNSPKLNYVYGRTDVKFVFEEERWKIWNMDWYEITSFVPWSYNPMKDYGLMTDPAAISSPEYIGKTTASDFYKIQNVLTRFVHNNREHAMEDTFAVNSNVSFCMPPLTSQTVVGASEVEKELLRLANMEKENRGKYLFVPTTSAPVIEVDEEGMAAVGQWLMSAYSFLGEAFGLDKDHYKFVRRIGVLKASFVKEDGEWRIRDFGCSILMELPEEPYDGTYIFGKPVNGRGYHRMARPENQWKPALPKMGGEYPEDAVVVEGMMAHWVNAYRTGSMVDYINNNMLNDEYEISFITRGQGLLAPPIVGKEAMMAFFTRPAFQYHHQQVTCHGGMSPDVEISMDGRFATVNYFDFNTSAYIPDMNYGIETTATLEVPDDFNADTTPFEHTPCVYQLSVYEHTFAKVNGEWKHIGVYWETLVRLNDICLAGKASRGWAGLVTDFKYPKIGQKYEYSGIKKVEKHPSKD